MDTKTYKTCDPSGFIAMTHDLSLDLHLNKKEKEPDKKMIYFTPKIYHDTQPWEANYMNDKTFHETFADAFRWLFKKMKENPPQTYLMLETMVWIINVNEGTISFRDFYQARDHAYELGILKDSQLVDTAPTAEESFDSPSQEWLKNNNGSIEYTCEFCGLYTANKPRCNKCEAET